MINLNQNFWFISFNLAANLQSKYPTRAKKKHNRWNFNKISEDLCANFVYMHRVRRLFLLAFLSFWLATPRKTGWIKSNVTTTLQDRFENVIYISLSKIWIHKLNYHRWAAEFLVFIFLWNIHFDPIILNVDDKEAARHQKNSIKFV